MKKSQIISIIVLLCFFMFFPFAASAKPITLTLADQNSEKGWGPVNATYPWARQVEEATGNRVKIQIYPNQTLAKGKQNWNAVKAGIADLSWNVMTYYAGLTPYADVITLPGLPFKTGEKGAEVIWKLFETMPEVNQQFAENKMLIIYPADPFIIITSKKEIKTLDDMKGLKVRTVGGGMVEVLKAYGATPMFIPMPDCYISLQKGTVDGVAGTWEAIHAFRLHEVGRYVADNIPIGTSYFAVAMNKNKWNSLPKDIQDAIMSVSGLKGSMFFGKNFFDSARVEVPKVAEKGGYELTAYALPEDERAKWVEIGCKPVWEAWVKRMEEKGYNKAREVLNTAIELSK